MLVALAGVQLYLFSPWHQHQAGQSQLCRFNPVEQGGGLEASGETVLPLPSLLCAALLSDPAFALPAGPRVELRASRAPPA